MNSKTAVCAYGKQGTVERVFERLFTMYLSNYSGAYYYGAVIDLPDSVCYRAPDDGAREEMARKCVEYLNKRCEGRFFCVMRQRRYVSMRNGYLYTCEGGAQGALKSVWRYLGGRKNELFPVYGCVPTEVERIYFSSFDEERPLTEGRKTLIDCIEPNGIFRLADRLLDGGAVFPSVYSNCCAADFGSIESFRDRRGAADFGSIESFRDRRGAADFGKIEIFEDRQSAADFEKTVTNGAFSGCDGTVKNSVFPITGAIVEGNQPEKTRRNGVFPLHKRGGRSAFSLFGRRKNGGNCEGGGLMSHEGLYTAEALDTLLFVGSTLSSIKNGTVSEVRLAAYPSFVDLEENQGERTSAVWR